MFINTKNVELKENIFEHTKVLDKKILLIHKFRGRRKIQSYKNKT